MIDRGYFHQCTDLEALDRRLCGSDGGSDGATAAAPEVVVGYLGFDATAPSLHVGSLLQIMILRHFQRCGHKPLVLVGGGTTKVGDPSGKDEARRLLGPEAIAANVVGIASVFDQFLAFGDGPTDAALVDNDAWLSGLNYLDFLREYGACFTVNRMLSFESVKARLSREQPLSFLEFNYMVLQAYDFLELHRRHGCAVQFGGSDQWGNIVNGIDLARKKDGAGLFGLTAPLITTSDGESASSRSSRSKPAVARADSRGVLDIFEIPPPLAALTSARSAPHFDSCFVFSLFCSLLLLHRLLLLHFQVRRWASLRPARCG